MNASEFKPTAYDHSMMSDRTYTALQTAAERMAAANYAEQFQQHVKSGRKPSTFRFTVTEAHRAVVDAMGSWTLTDEEAMALLHEYPVFLQRTGKGARR